MKQNFKQAKEIYEETEVSESKNEMNTREQLKHSRTTETLENSQNYADNSKLI